MDTGQLHGETSYIELPYISSKKQESLDFQSNVLPDRCAVDGQTWNHGGRVSFLPGLFSGHS